MDSAIRSLNELRLGSTDDNLGSAAPKPDVTVEPNVQSQGACTFNFWLLLTCIGLTDILVCVVIVFLEF